MISDSSIKLDDSVVSKRDAVPENKPTEALPQGLRQLNNKESDPQESQFKGRKLKYLRYCH